jgi:hypothetical protein
MDRGRAVRVAAAIAITAVSVSLRASIADALDPSITLTPTAAAPGSTVSITGSGAPAPESGECLVEVDGSGIPDASCFILAGEIVGTFVVPDLDRSTVTVSACWNICDPLDDVDPSWEASASLEVLPPAEPVTMPDLRCMSYDEAERTLKEHGLGVAESTRDGFVLGQSPAAGTLVDPTTLVSVELAQTVPAPPLVGLALDQARTVVSDSCLLLEVEPAAESGTVAAQDTPPGSEVVPGSTITVSVLGPPPTTTPTTPAPPTFTGSGQDDTGSSGPPFRPRWHQGVLAGSVAAVAGGGVLLWRNRGRSHRRLRWAKAHIVARPVPDPAPRSRVDPADAEGADVRITLVSHHDQPETTIEENPR